MNILYTPLKGVCVISPDVHTDNRGYFLESYNYKIFPASVNFVQDNMSSSKLGVIRGLHYQVNNPQGKLVSCIKGTIYDVVVDIRKDSPTCGKFFGVILSERNHEQIWVPPGFAHGFMGLDDENIIYYKCTEFYEPKNERTILYNDPDLGIKFPRAKEYIVSDKDLKGSLLKNAELL